MQQYILEALFDLGFTFYRKQLRDGPLILLKYISI